MARLGRGRRSGARITRGPVTPTQTPLVRNSAVVKQTRRERFVLVRLAHRLRVRIVRAPLAPLVAVVPKRVVPPRRTAAGARFARFARRPGATVLRAPFAAVVPTRPVLHRSAGARLYRLARRPGATIIRAPLAPLVTFVRAKLVKESSTRSRYVARHKARARIVRAPSVATATPYIAKHVVVHTQTLRRPAQLRLRRRDPLVLRSPLPAPPPFVAPRAPLVSKRRVPVARLRRHHPVIVRAPVVLTVATRRAPVIVTRVRRTPLVTRARHHRALVLRSPFATQTVRAPLVVRSRRAQRQRLARNAPLILRATPFRTATPLVRKRVVLETQTGNRARVVARRRHHSQPFIAGLARLAYLASVARFTGTFDPSGTRGPGATSPTVADFDPETHNMDASNATVADFDPPKPR